MTEFYLDPREEFFFKMQRHMSEQRETICVKAIAPLDFPDELYAELFDKVQTLRPGVFTVDLTWPKLKELCVTHLSEVGYLYDAKANVFHAIPPHPARCPRKKKKRSSSEKRLRAKSESSSRVPKTTQCKVEYISKELVSSNGERLRTLAISGGVDDTGQCPATGQDIVKEPDQIVSDDSKVATRLVKSDIDKVATVTSCLSLTGAGAEESVKLKSSRTGNCRSDDVSHASVDKIVVETTIALNKTQHVACMDVPTRDSPSVNSDPSCNSGDVTRKDIPAEEGIGTGDLRRVNMDNAAYPVTGDVASKTAACSELAAKTDSVCSKPCEQHTTEKISKTKTKAALVKLLRQRTVHGAAVHADSGRQLLQDVEPAHAGSINMQRLSLSAKADELSPESNSQCDQTSHLNKEEKCGSSLQKRSDASVSPERQAETKQCGETSSSAPEQPTSSGTPKGTEPESDLESILHMCIVNALSVTQSKMSPGNHKSPDDTNAAPTVDNDKSSNDSGQKSSQSQTVGEQEPVKNIVESAEIPTFVQAMSVDNCEVVSKPSLLKVNPNSSVQSSLDAATVMRMDNVNEPCSATSDHKTVTDPFEDHQYVTRVAPVRSGDTQKRGDDSAEGANTTDDGHRPALKPELASCAATPVANGHLTTLPRRTAKDCQVSDEDESSTDDGGCVTFKCRFCRRRFESLSRRRQHQEWVCSMRADLVKSGPGEFVCLVCGASFKKKPGLNRHVSRMHPEAISSDDQTAAAKQKLAKVNGIKAVRVKKTKIRATKGEFGGLGNKVNAQFTAKRERQRTDSATLVVGDANNLGDGYDGSTDVSTYEDDNDAGAEDTSVDSAKMAMRGRAKPTPRSVVNGSHIKGKMAEDYHLSQCTVRLSRLSADAIATYQKEDATKPCNLDDQPTLCDLCGLHCLDVGMLEDHILDEHQLTVVLSHVPVPQNQVFLCEFCGDAFVRPSRLRAHMMNLHGNATATTDVLHPGNVTETRASELFVKRISDLLKTASKPEEFIEHIAATVDKVKSDTGIGVQLPGVKNVDMGIVRAREVVTGNSVPDQKTGSSQLSNQALDTRMTVGEDSDSVENRQIVPKSNAGNIANKQDIPQLSSVTNSLQKPRTISPLAARKPEVIEVSTTIRVSKPTGVRRDLTQKIRIVDVRKFQCSACTTEFGTRAAFEHHRNEACRTVAPTAIVSQRFICRFCGFPCATISRCHEHVNYAHGGDRMPPAEPVVDKPVGLFVPKSSVPATTAVRPPQNCTLHPKGTILRYGAGVDALHSNGDVARVTKRRKKKDGLALKTCAQYHGTSMFVVKALTCSSCNHTLKVPPTPGKPRQCTACKSRAPLETVKLYQCMYCEQTFPTKVACRAHEISKCMKGAVLQDLPHGLYTCESCKRSYSRKQDLTRHLKSHGPNSQSEAASTAEQTSATSRPENADNIGNATNATPSVQQQHATPALTHEPGRHQCPTCSLIFTAATPLKLHILNEHGYGRANPHKTQMRKKGGKQRNMPLQFNVISKADVLSGARTADGKRQGDCGDFEKINSDLHTAVQVSVHSAQNESVNSSQGSNIVSQPSLPVMLTTKNVGVLTNGCDIRGAPVTGSLPSPTVWQGAAVSSGIAANSTSVQSNHVLLPSNPCNTEPLSEMATPQASADDSVELLLDTLPSIECMNVAGNAGDDSTEKGLDELPTCILAQLADMLSEQKEFGLTSMVASTQASRQVFIPNTTPITDSRGSRQSVEESHRWPTCSQATIAESLQIGDSRHEHIGSNAVVSSESAPLPTVEQTLADVSLSMNAWGECVCVSGETTGINSEQQDSCNQVLASTVTTRGPDGVTCQGNEAVTVMGNDVSGDSERYQDSTHPGYFPGIEHEKGIEWGGCARHAERITVETPRRSGDKPVLFGLDFSRTIYVKLVPRKKPTPGDADESNVPQAVDGSVLTVGGSGDTDQSVVEQPKTLLSDDTIPPSLEAYKMTVEQDTRHDGNTRQTWGSLTSSDISPTPDHVREAAEHGNVRTGEGTNETASGEMSSEANALISVTIGKGDSAANGDTPHIPNMQTESESTLMCSRNDVGPTLNAVYVIGAPSDPTVSSETDRTSSCVTKTLPDDRVCSVEVPDDEASTSTSVVPNDVVHTAVPLVPDYEYCATTHAAANKEECAAVSVVPDHTTYTGIPGVQSEVVFTEAPVASDNWVFATATVVPNDVAYSEAHVLPENLFYAAAPVVPDTTAPVVVDGVVCARTPVVPSDMVYTTAPIVSDVAYVTTHMSDEQETLPFDLAVQEIANTLDRIGCNNEEITEEITEDTHIGFNGEAFQARINDVVIEEVVENSVLDGIVPSSDVLDHAEPCIEDGTDKVGVSGASGGGADGQAYLPSRTSDHAKCASTGNDSSDWDVAEDHALDERSSYDNVSATSQRDTLDNKLTGPGRDTQTDDPVVSEDARNSNLLRDIQAGASHNTEGLQCNSETEIVKDVEHNTQEQTDVCEKVTTMPTENICREMTTIGLGGEVNSNGSVSLVTESAGDDVTDNDEGDVLCPADNLAKVLPFADDESSVSHVRQTCPEGVVNDSCLNMTAGLEGHTTCIGEDSVGVADVATQVKHVGNDTVSESTAYEQSVLDVGEAKSTFLKENKSTIDQDDLAAAEGSTLASDEDESIVPEQVTSAVDKEEYVATGHRKPTVGEEELVAVTETKTLSSLANPETENTVVILPKALDSELEEAVCVDNITPTAVVDTTNQESGSIAEDVCEAVDDEVLCIDMPDIHIAEAELYAGLKQATEKLSACSEPQHDRNQVTEISVKCVSAEVKTNRDAATSNNDEETPHINTVKPEESVKTEDATIESSPTWPSKLVGKTTEGRTGSRQRKGVLATQRKYRCEHCTPCLSFSRRYSFQLHQKIVHNIRSDGGEERMPKECLVCPICHGAPEFNEVLGLQCHMKWLHGVNNFSLARPVPQTVVGDHSDGVCDDDGDNVHVNEGVADECWIDDGKTEEGVSDDGITAGGDVMLEVEQTVARVTDVTGESTVGTDCQTVRLHHNESEDKTVVVLNKTDNDDQRDVTDSKDRVDHSESYDSATAPADESEGVSSHNDVDGSTAVTSDDSKGVVDAKEINDSAADTSDCLGSTTDSEVQRTHDRSTRKRRGGRCPRKKSSSSLQRTPGRRRGKQRTVSCSPTYRHSESDASTDDSRKLVRAGGLRTRSGVVLPEILPPSRLVKVSMEVPTATDGVRSESLSPVRPRRGRPPGVGKRRSAPTDVSCCGGLRTRSGVVLSEIIPPSRPDVASPKNVVKTKASVGASAGADHTKPSAGKRYVNKVPPKGTGGGLRTRSGIVLPERIPPPRCVIAKPDVPSPTADVASTDGALTLDNAVPSVDTDVRPEPSSFGNGETEHLEARKPVEESHPQHSMPPTETTVAVENVEAEQFPAIDVPNVSALLPNYAPQMDDAVPTTTDPPEDKQDHPESSEVLPGDTTSVWEQDEHPTVVAMSQDEVILVEPYIVTPSPPAPDSTTAAVVAVVPGDMHSNDGTGTCATKPKCRRTNRHNVHSIDDLAIRGDAKRDVHSKSSLAHGKMKPPHYTNKTSSGHAALSRPPRDIGEIKSSASPDDLVTQTDTSDTIAVGAVAADDTQPAECGSSVSRKRSSPDRLDAAAAAVEPPQKMLHPVTGFLCECQLCGEQYTRRYHLERHMSRIHKKKSTAWPWRQLSDETHTIIATKLLWRCSECGRMFVMARAWRTHMATKHHVDAEPVKLDSDVAVENAKSTYLNTDVDSVKPDCDIANLKPTSPVFTDVRDSYTDAICSVDDVANSSREKCDDSSEVGKPAADATNVDSHDTAKNAHTAEDDKQFALTTHLPQSSFDSWLKVDTRSAWLTGDRRPVPNSSLPWLSENPPTPQHIVYVSKRSKQMSGSVVKSTTDEASSQVSQPLNDGISQSREHSSECSTAARKDKSSVKTYSKERRAGVLLSHQNIPQTERTRRARRSSETLSLSSDTCPAEVGIGRSSSDFTSHESKSPARLLSELHEKKAKSPGRPLSESHKETKPPTRRCTQTHEKKTESPTRQLPETHDKKKSPTRRLSEPQDFSLSTVTAKLATPRKHSTEQRLSRTKSPQTFAKCKTSKTSSLSCDADQRKDHTSTEKTTVQSVTPPHSSACEMKPRKRHLSESCVSTLSSVDATKLRRDSRPPKQKSVKSDHAEAKVHHKHEADGQDVSADAGVKCLAPSSSHSPGTSVPAAPQIGSLNKSVCPRRRVSAILATSQKVKRVSFGEALQSASPRRTRSIHKINASQQKHMSKAPEPLKTVLPNTSSDDKHAKRRTTLPVQNRHSSDAGSNKNAAGNKLSPQKLVRKSTSRHGVLSAHSSSDKSCSSPAKSTTRTKSSSKPPKDRLTTAPLIKSSESHEHYTTSNTTDESRNLLTCGETSEFPGSTSHGVVREKTHLVASTASHLDKVLRGNSSKRDGRGSGDSLHMVKRKETKLTHLKRTASEHTGSLNRSTERTSVVPQSVKSAKRDLTTTKASAPPMDPRTGNAEACKTVSQHSNAKNNDGDAKGKTRSNKAEPAVGGRMSKRRRTLPDLFGVPLNSSYIT